MGIITSENNMQFRSSRSMIDRIKKKLEKMDALNLIDEGDFYKHIKFMIEQFGTGAYREAEGVLPIKDFKTKLPPGFSKIHIAIRTTFKGSMRPAPSINEQRPWIFYTDTETSLEKRDPCCIECVGEEIPKTKIVVRTFVNGEDDNCFNYQTKCLLSISSNVKDQCTDDSPSLFCPGADEITIKDGYIYTMFDSDSIYIQYYALALDEEGLPMIPDVEILEKAIEYYIYTQLFEEVFWNSKMDIQRILEDARNQYDTKYLPEARYWLKLPTFASLVKSIRRARGNKKFYQFTFDKTVVNG